MKMEDDQSTAAEKLVHLRKARTLCLKDDVYWPRVFESVVPFITQDVPELRRWSTEFFAEAFSSPALDDARKTAMAVSALDTLVHMIQGTEADSLKLAVQSSASVYPLIFRYICQNPKQSAEWQMMGLIKQKILWLWDAGPSGVKVCCIKFVQRAIQVQTPGVVDPRLVNKAEISLSAVPANHPLLSRSALEAEAQGLLDRLLGVFHDDPMDPLILTATLNCLSVLIKTRSAALSTRILNAVLSFNPLALAMKNPTPGNKLFAKCIEKTVRIFLLNLIRSNPSGQYTQRITQHLHRLQLVKLEVLDDTSRKRPAIAPPGFQTQDKRQKIEVAATPAPVAAAPVVRPRPPPPPFTGPPTYANLFTLTRDSAVTGFHAQDLPVNICVQAGLATFRSTSQEHLDAVVQAVRDRLNSLIARAATPQAAQPPPQPGGQAPAATAEEDLDSQPYVPAYSPPSTPPGETQPTPTPEEPKPKEEDADEEELEIVSEVEYQLPPPPMPTNEQRIEAACSNVDRLFDVLDQLDRTPLIHRKDKGGLLRMSAAELDRDAWTTIISRLATRGLGACDVEVKGEDGRIERQPSRLAQYVRQRLLAYVLADFRQNLDAAGTWLYEEWYNDMVMAQTAEGADRPKQYHYWLLKVVDGILPFVEAKDRLVIRFLSEVPQLSKEVLDKVKILCLDPDRASLGIQILHYNAMLRPPVRQLCLDLFEDFYHNHKELSNMAVKFLKKWRPRALEVPLNPNVEMGNSADSTNAPTQSSESSERQIVPQSQAQLVDGVSS